MICSVKAIAKFLLPRNFWFRLVEARHALRASTHQFRIDRHRIGAPGALALAVGGWEWLGGRESNRRIWPIWLRSFRDPIFFRCGGSDLAVIRQVLVEEEYACIGYEDRVQYIIDCGANIGCTSLYLLRKYPRARAIVVEPDPHNMSLCRRTLAAVSDRVIFVQSGVWSHSSPMVIERGLYRDGAEWSVQVRPARDGEKPDFQAKTIDELISLGSFPRVDILKMDIEASEAAVFGAGTERWLGAVRTLAIELHDAHCERVVSAAVSPFLPRISKSGELAIYRFNVP